MSQVQGWSIPAELEREMTPAVRAFVEGLLAVLQRRIEQLEAQVEQLQRQLRDRQGPSRPKTQDEATPPAPPPKPKAKRKQGAQPGHPKHERTLLPTEQCQEVVPLKPTTCRRCGESLAGDDPEPLRHQVWELPPIQLEVTEYQQHRLPCPSCGTSTCAELPAGVPTGESGPRLVAFVALLMACFRQSKRRVSLFLETVFDAPCSAGLAVKLQNIATEALRPCYEQLREALPDQPSVNADETGTKQQNRKAWLWTVVASTFTVFALRLTKAAPVIQELLTLKYRGVVSCDRAKMYWWAERVQWCWAHLQRDFEKMVAAGGKAANVGQELLDLTHQLFHYWHRVRDGTLSQVGWKRHYHRLYGQVYLALEEGTFCRHHATAATCDELLERYDWLWTFAECDGVEPTNNAAERSLRHGVIWRNLSFGTQSASGSQFVETLLSVLETCRQQDRDVFAFITEAITRHFKSQPAPSLLPTN